MHKKSYIILSLLKDAGKGTLQLLSDLMESGYQSRAHTMSYLWGNKELTRHTNKKQAKECDQKLLIKNYYSCIKRLEDNGLISRHGESKDKYIEITAHGKEALKKAGTSKTHISRYYKESSNSYILIVFDIPELTKQKRDWLREVLKQLGFRMIQKSVWIGKTLIPTNLVDDLKDMSILHYINFFKVEKYRPAEPAK